MTRMNSTDASMRESRGEYEAMETAEADSSGPGPQRCKSFFPADMNCKIRMGHSGGGMDPFRDRST